MPPRRSPAKKTIRPPLPVTGGQGLQPLENAGAVLPFYARGLPPDGQQQVTPAPAPTAPMPPEGRTDTTPMTPVYPGGYRDTRSAGVYRTPQQNEAALRAAGQTQAQVHQAALTYANQRLATLRTVASVVKDPALFAILNSSDQPLAKYTAASRRWTELAHAAGYQDPRVWLKDMMQRWRTG